jgi:hypothetical protein
MVGAKHEKQFVLVGASLLAITLQSKHREQARSYKNFAAEAAPANLLSLNANA